MYLSQRRRPAPDDGLLGALTHGSLDRAEQVATEAMVDGISPEDVLVEMLQPALHDCGALWASGAIGVAEEHAATGIAEQLIDQIGRLTRRPGVPHGGRVVLAAAPGERHTLGLRIVRVLLEARGHDVLWLGADAPAGALVAVVDVAPPAAIGISTTCREHLVQAFGAMTRVAAAGVPLVVGGQASPPVELHSSPRLARGGSGHAAVEAFEQVLAR